MSEAPARPRPSGLALGIACVYLVFAVVAGRVWEPAHDEGVTWHQSIAALSIAPAPAAPVAVDLLYALLDGGGPYSAGDVIEAQMQRGGTHPPAYYLALHAWASLVGTDRTALLFPTYGLGVVALFAMRRLAHRLAPGPHSADWAMAMLAVSPWFVAYSNFARPYAVVVCLSIVSTSIVLGGDSARQWKRLVAFVFVSIVGLYTLYHYAFVVAWQLLLLTVLAIRQPGLGLAARRRRVLEVAAAGLGIAAGFAPWLPRLLAHLDVTGASSSYFFAGFVSIDQWPTLLGRLVLLFGIGDAVHALGSRWFIGAFAVLGLSTLPLMVASWMGRRGAFAADLVWASVPVLPALILAADWLHGTHTLFLTKTTFALLPFLLLLVVRAFAWLPPGPKRVGLTAWLVLLLTSTMADLHTHGATHTPMEVVAADIARRDDPSHVVVLSSTFPGFAPPFLLNLRLAGVERVRVGYAPWFDLDDLIDAVTADPTIRTVTLVNFDVTYSPAERWKPEHLDAAAARAGATGWDVSRFRNLTRLLEPGSEGEGRQLRILPAIPSRYFSF